MQQPARHDRHRPERARLARRAVLAAGLLLWSAATVPGAGPAVGQAAPDGPGCEQPYRQILVERTFGYSTDRATTVVWPRGGVVERPSGPSADPDLSTRWLDEGIDTDGDGSPDVIEGAFVGQDQLVSIRRGDGTVLLSMAGHALASLDRATVGDLDADGRDELVVLARPVSLDGGADRYFVVPGATPAGHQELDEVAVEVPGSGVMGVGDQGDGPGADLVVRTGILDDPADPRHRQTFIASGDSLMEGGPGSTGLLVPVVEPYEGFPMAVVDLGDERPAIISGVPWGAAEPSIRGLVLQRSGELTRFELSEPFDSQGDLESGWPPRFAHATAVRYEQPEPELYLELVGIDRGGSIRALWSIDDPCTELPVASGSAPEPGPEPVGPAGPARPRPGVSSYTG